MTKNTDYRQPSELKTNEARSSEKVPRPIYSSPTPSPPVYPFTQGSSLCPEPETFCFLFSPSLSGHSPSASLHLSFSWFVPKMSISSRTYFQPFSLLFLCSSSEHFYPYPCLQPLSMWQALRNLYLQPPQLL